jgi:type VI secretion system Hcp family effector
MALNAYLRIKGQTTGEVKGSVTQKGRESKIMVIAASHEIESPRDPRTGLLLHAKQQESRSGALRAVRASCLYLSENYLDLERGRHYGGR